MLLSNSLTTCLNDFLKTKNSQNNSKTSPKNSMTNQILNWKVNFSMGRSYTITQMDNFNPKNIIKMEN